MGIRGLSSLLSWQESLFRPINLPGTFLVIDGNNISIWLYQDHCPRSALNGDYNAYAMIVRKFFRYLKKCQIVPIVILDGAHEERKLHKTKSRMQDRISRNLNIQSIHACGEPPWPALLKEVFKNTLVEEQILHCQCLLEADVDITKTAQFFNCPVLSSDADFYFNNVTFIPLNKLDIQQAFTGQQHILSAKQFDRSKFFDIYGNLPVEFLPLLSYLLGNDYSGTTTMNSSWSGFDIGSKIVELIQWLQNFASPIDAVNDHLTSILDPELKDRTKREMLRCLTEQNSDQWSYLVHYLQHRVSAEAADGKSSVTSGLNIQALNGSSEWLDKAVNYMADKIPIESWTKAPIPEWILNHHIVGKLPREVMDIIYSQTFFFTLQIEDHSKESVSARMLQIFQRILGIIYHSYPEKNNPSITIYLREGDRVKEKKVIPLHSSLSCAFTKIPSLSTSNREKIALDVLKLGEIQENAVPHDWKLFIITLADWYKANMEHEMTTAALGCLIFSGIFVKVIEEKVPNYKDTDFNDVMKQRLGRQGSEAVDEPFSRAISNVDLDDCKVALKLFSEFRNPLMSRKISVQLNKVILHYLALFQSWTILVELLNSVLNFPFSILKIENFLCGTLAYNIYFDIKKHENLQSFIDVKFKETPTLQTLFFAAMKLVEKLSKCTILSRQISHEKVELPRKRSGNENDGPSRDHSSLSHENYEPQRGDKRGSYENYETQRKRPRSS